MKKILVIDDEANIGMLLKMVLELEGYQVVVAASGQEGYAAAQSHRPDLILLDLMLPDGDGVSLCQKIRTNTDLRAIPIIMLTAKTEETDMIIGLEVGADDYITKPFSNREVVARIKVLFRRIDDLNHKSIEPVWGLGGKVIQLGGLLIHTDQKKAYLNHAHVDLAPAEYKLVELLGERAGEIVTRDEILTMLSDKGQKPDEKLVNVLVSHIRKKFAQLDDKNYIQTVRGKGYSMVKL